MNNKIATFLSVLLPGAAYNAAAMEPTAHPGNDVGKKFFLKLPLVQDAHNVYAAHYSHSSHASHSSHVSSATSYGTPSASPKTPPAQSTPSRKSTAPNQARSKSSLAELVYRVQITLATKGYKVNNFDGVLGNQTRDAIKQYQKDHGLKANGRLSTNTLNSLGISIPR